MSVWRMLSTEWIQLWNSFENYFTKWKTQCTLVMIVNKGMFFSSVFSLSIFHKVILSKGLSHGTENLLWSFALFQYQVLKPQWYFLTFQFVQGNCVWESGRDKGGQAEYNGKRRREEKTEHVPVGLKYHTWESSVSPQQH